jgi:hypothetical protein
MASWLVEDCACPNGQVRLEQRMHDEKESVLTSEGVWQSQPDKNVDNLRANCVCNRALRERAMHAKKLPTRPIEDHKMEPWFR